MAYSKDTQSDIQPYLEEESGARPKRKGTMTEKGLTYTLHAKDHNLHKLCRKIVKLESVIQVKLEDSSTDYENVRLAYVDWLTLLEQIIEERNSYCSILQSNDAPKEYYDKLLILDDNIDTYLYFKKSVITWLQDKEDSRQQNAKLEDKSSHVSKTISEVSHVSSARLKEEQTREELKAKSIALKKKQEVEKEKLKLKFKEEELELETEMAISDARWKVIDEWQEKQSSKGSILDRGERKIGDKDITHVPYNNDDADEFGSFNVDAQDSKPKSPTVLVDRDGVSPYLVPINDVKGEAFSSSSNMISSVVQQLRKPPVEMMVFKGNPLEYRRFVRQFKAKVLVNTENNDERLNYLEQFTDGEVKNIVQSYGYLDAERGFPAVMKELEQRYGDDAVIVNAFIEKALNWPLIRADNPKQLDAYAVYLSECEHAVNSNILDYTEHIRNLVVKLPYQYQERFRTLVQTLKDNGRNVKFTDLVQFVRKEAKK